MFFPVRLPSLRGLVEIEETVNIKGTPISKRGVLKKVIESLKILSPAQVKKIGKKLFSPKFCKTCTQKYSTPSYFKVCQNQFCPRETKLGAVRQPDLKLFRELKAKN